MAGGGLLDNDEVDFLLKDSQPGGDRAGAGSVSSGSPADADRDVTMRGDLDQIELADIFQTLSISKMEGVLRIQNPLEKRQLFFRDGLVRCVLGQRLETFRIGQRLIRAGLITPDQLRSALLTQKRSRGKLGQVLVEQDLGDQADIDEIAVSQLQEDLFSLFTWRHGSFAFYRGTPTDPVLLDLIEHAPEFEVNGVLLEVARRSDEWERTFAAIGSLDEIFIHTDDHVPEHCSAEHQAVLDAADGTRNVRDLADVALLELFECGIIVRELIELGCLVLTPVEQILAYAEQTVAEGDAKRAMLTVGSLLDRGQALGRDDIIHAARILAHCGERRYACRLLIDASNSGTFTDDQNLELAREARELDRRSLASLERLVGMLDSGEVRADAELAGARTDLAEALIDAERYDEALAVLRRIEVDTDDPGGTCSQIARVLARTDRRDEAVECLLGFAKSLDATRDKVRLIATYEQILRIDYRRRDVARALKSIHASKLARRVKFAGTIVVAIAIGLIGFVQVRATIDASAIDSTAARIAAALAEDDDTAAIAMLAELEESYPDHVGVESVRATLRNWQLARSTSRQREAIDLSETVDQAARDHIDAGRVADALELYYRLLDKGLERQRVERLIATQIDRVLFHTREVVDPLLPRLPPAPRSDMSRDEQERILALLESDFDPALKLAVRGFVALAEDPRIASVLGKDFDAKMGALRGLDEFLRRADRRTAEYREVRDDVRVAEELTPLFHRAREFERSFRFHDALRDYRTLASKHPDDDDLKHRFDRMVERYASIVNYLEVIDQATRAGDFESARGQLEALEQAYPEIPFGELTHLPVRIETTPPGAVVSFDGEQVGTAPLIAAYRPGVETRVRVELAGFHAEETVLTGTSIGVVRSLLARRATWTHHASATIDRALLALGDRLLVYADRGGAVVGVDLADGQSRWRVDFEDLSGLLTAPSEVPRSDRVVVGSFDGPLRCIDTRRGAVLWTIPDLATESAPVCVAGIVVMPTRDGRLAAIDPLRGERLWTYDLPGPVRAEPRVDGNHVIVVTHDGRALALRITDGRRIWSTNVGRGVIAAPAVAHGRVAIGADDGTVTVLDAATGELRWRQRGLPPLALRPAIAAGRVIVIEGRNLRTFDLDSGEPQLGLESRREFDGGMSFDDAWLFVADRGGVVHAFDPVRLEARFLLRSASTAIAPVLRLEDGTIVVAFQDRSLCCYAPLP